MTLDEAVDVNLNRIKGVLTALQAASNQRPIVMPDGRPAPSVQPPNHVQMLAVLLDAQFTLLQVVRNTNRMLQGGFALSDQEAARIAELVTSKTQAGNNGTGKEPCADPASPRV